MDISQVVITRKVRRSVNQNPTLGDMIAKVFYDWEGLELVLNDPDGKVPRSMIVIVFILVSIFVPIAILELLYLMEH